MRLDVHEVSKRYAIPGRSLAADGGWAETGKTIVFVTHAIEEAVSIGTTLVMMSARPARVRELIRNDGGRDRHALVDHLNQVILE